MSSIRGDPLANTGPCHADLRRILLQFQQQKTRLADWRAFWVSSSQLLALRERGLAQTKFLRCLPTSAILWLRFFDLHQVLSSDLGKSQRQRITHGYVSCRCCTSGNSLTSLDLLMTHAGEGRVKPTVLLHCLLFPYLCYTHYTEWNQSIPTEEWVPGLLITRYVIVLLLTLTSHYYHCLWFLHSCSSQTLSWLLCSLQGRLFLRLPHHRQRLHKVLHSIEGLLCLKPSDGQKDQKTCLSLD